MKRIIHTLILLIMVSSLAVGQAFITTWKTDNPGTSNANQITLPTLAGGGGYNYDVDWGDGNSDTGITSSSPNTHTYASAGTYTVTISGSFPRFFFNNAGDKKKLLTVEQWGDIAWNALNFHGCSNLQVTAADAPDLSGVNSLSNLFRDCTSLTGGLANWNTQNIVFMLNVFMGATSFNGDIGNWNTSNVENMSSMFAGCTVFNDDIGNWNTAKVKFFNSMFYDARDFNQNIGSWNTSSAIDMNGMFFQAFDFNQNISGWNTSNVTNMRVTFYRALAFDQDLSGWNTSNVTIMKSMFFACPFNQDISSWNVSKVTDMDFMFAQSGFDQDVSGWDVSSVTTMVDIFDLSALSLDNYDKILNGWAQQTLQNNVTFGAEGVKYCAGSAARQSIIDTYNWTITDGGKYCVVTIPDVNFKAYLLASEINSVDDGEITYEEAESLTGGLIIRELSIADLTGIEAFVNMTSIDCYGNNLTTLDLSANVALTTINCRNNLLTSLNVSGLVNLNNLDFSDNLLTSVDVSSLAAVNYIGASGNQLTSIDVSNNLNLEDFAIYENPLLTSIDISANTSLVYLEAYDNPLLTRVNAANGNNEIIEIFDLRDNPSLTCITVDDVAYSTTNWTDIDVAASFSTDCRADNEITFNPIANQFLEIGTLTLSATSSSGLPVGFEVVSGPVSLAGNTLTFTDPGTVIVKATQPGDEDYKAAVPVEQSFDIILVTALPEQQGPQFKFYPNPVDRSLIVIPNGSNNYISLQDVQGRIVTKSESKSNEAILLDVSALPLGMYILRLSNEAGVSQTKILKK